MLSIPCALNENFVGVLCKSRNLIFKPTVESRHLYATREDSGIEVA
jgi:hypothetical protein